MGRCANRSRRVAAVAGLLLAAALAPACGESRAGYGPDPETDESRSDALFDSPKVFGELPEFELVDQDGHEVTRQDLLGTPFAMAFVFTTCTGPCPVISSNMARLQEELADTDVRLVSLSVDPETDTPEVLSRYAEEVGADTSRWTLLTGDEGVIDGLIRNSMYLVVGRRPPSEEFPIGMNVSHSSKLVAFDRRCRIRGYYSGVTEEGLEAVEKRLRYLATEDL